MPQRQRYDWAAIRERYAAGTMHRNELAREHTGNPADPCRKQIWKEWAAGDWESLRTARQAVSSQTRDADETTSQSIETISASVSNEQIALALQEEQPHWSDNLPSRYSRHYQAAVSDPDLLSMRRDIAVLGARLADLTRRADSGESGWMWKELRRALDGMLTAKQNGDDAKAMESFNMMVRLIKSGHTDTMTWQEITNTIVQRKQLVESERKRLLEFQEVQKQMMGEMEMYAVDLLQAITDEIQDVEMVERIKSRYLRIRQTRGQKSADVA